MPRLSENDYRNVLEVLREAGDVRGPVAFTRPVLEALRRVVPCDVVAYHERIDGVNEPGPVFAGEPRGPVTPEIREAEACYAHQDPMTPTEGARKYSDFLSRREHHRLELYQEADRPLGIEFMMRLWLDSRGTAGARLEFDRAGPDFSERDRAVLDRLLPYLKQLRYAAAIRRRAITRPMSRTKRLTPREREILEHVAEGRTNGEVAWLLGISPETVRKHLENAYEKLGVHTRTGAVAAVFPR
jgi:DNA-binding CsgD family transcriptional regulator